MVERGTVGGVEGRKRGMKTGKEENERKSDSQKKIKEEDNKNERGDKMNG